MCNMKKLLSILIAIVILSGCQSSLFKADITDTQQESGKSIILKGQNIQEKFLEKVQENQ